MWETRGLDGNTWISSLGDWGRERLECVGGQTPEGPGDLVYPWRQNVPGERAQEAMSRVWISRKSLLAFQGGCCPSPSRGRPVHGEPGTAVYLQEPGPPRG